MKKLKLISHQVYTKEELEIQYLFNKLINESKGISDEVETEASFLEESLYEYFKTNILSKIDYNKKEVHVFTNEFETELFNNTITLSIKWILFKDAFTAAKNILRKGISELVSNGKTDKSFDLRQLCLNQESHVL